MGLAVQASSEVEGHPSDSVAFALAAGAATQAVVVLGAAEAASLAVLVAFALGLAGGHPSGWAEIALAAGAASPVEVVLEAAEAGRMLCPAGWVESQELVLAVARMERQGQNWRPAPGQPARRYSIHTASRTAYLPALDCRIAGRRSPLDQRLPAAVQVRLEAGRAAVGRPEQAVGARDRLARAEAAPETPAPALALETLLAALERQAVVAQRVGRAAVYRIQVAEAAESLPVALAPVLPSRMLVAAGRALAGSDWCDLALALPGLALAVER